MKYQYSIAICPPQYVVEIFKKLKKELRDVLKDRYGSINSEAHITINVFLADENELKLWERYLAEFCSKLQSFTIRLNTIGSYDNGAFFLSSDKTSSEILIPLMKRFHKDAPVRLKDKSTDPHMSIARQLLPEQLKSAYDLFGSRIFDLPFVCDNLAIRKFNPIKKQYEIYKRFEFGKQVDWLLF